MTSTAFFSIVIPTHNRPGMLARALKSIYAQSFKSFEIIVIDDGSEVCYLDVLSMFRDTIRYIKLPIQKGVSNARNHGILISQGHWIIFLDDDDEFSSTFLFDMHQKIFSEKASDDTFFWANVRVIYYDHLGGTYEKIMDYSHETEYGTNNYVKASTIGCGHGLTIPRKAIRAGIKFDDCLHHAEDTEFIVHLMAKNYYPKFINAIGTIKHNHMSGRLSQTITKYSSSKVYERIFKRYEYFFKQHPDVYCSMLYWTIIVHYMSKDFTAGDRAFIKYFFLKWLNISHLKKIMELYRLRSSFKKT